jgi:hypothetical protein
VSSVDTYYGRRESQSASTCFPYCTLARHTSCQRVPRHSMEHTRHACASYVAPQFGDRVRPWRTIHAIPSVRGTRGPRGGSPTVGNGSREAHLTGRLTPRPHAGSDSTVTLTPKRGNGHIVCTVRSPSDGPARRLGVPADCRDRFFLPGLLLLPP